MSEENVEIVRRGYELYAAGEIEEVAKLFDADAEIADAGGLGVSGTAAGTRQGPEGFLRINEETMDVFEDYKVKTDEFIDAGEGDVVVVAVRIIGRGKASGAELEMRLAHMWVFRDGKVIRGEVYRSTEDALEAARRAQ